VNTFSALHTDRYELTMVDAAMQSGTHDRACIFEVFARRLPAGRRYGIVAGTGRLLELIENFCFTDADICWLADTNVVHPQTLDWLANYKFSGTITGYHEGEVYFPGSPILMVDAPFAEGVILETLILSVMNYDSAVASAASRMVSAAHGRPLAEMGSRRTNESAAVAAARAAFIAGFSATSNMEAGRIWGVPTMGTAAHAFTLLHNNEEAAFHAQVKTLGPNTTLLVDTFNVRLGIEHAISIAGPQLEAIRLDSGDLPALVTEVRKQLDTLGATQTKITVTNDLDEYTIGVLAASPVDSYGVGTSVVTGSGAPTADMVYKLVARKDTTGDWTAVAKKSPRKVTFGGRKNAIRRLDIDGIAIAEDIQILTDSTAPNTNGRGLLVPLMTKGIVNQEYLGTQGTQKARDHRAMALAELPVKAHRLGRGDPVLPTVYM
jgi:nicotinate phosphoribosyltransferase